MNENFNAIELTRLLHKLTQALYNDGILYFSGEPKIATDARKITLQNDINLIKEHITYLEEILS